MTADDLDLPTGRAGSTARERTGRGTRPDGDKPLVYSCSGCSSAAQLANTLAIRLDRLGLAEMSCIAGLGGDVPSLVRLARSGRPILALDCCPLVCVQATLRRHDITPDGHVILSRYGVRKRRHADFDEEDAQRLLPVATAATAALTAVTAATNGSSDDEGAGTNPASGWQKSSQQDL
ncbi:putative zinc-binding protein [Micromonospora sp. NPDC003197]